MARESTAPDGSGENIILRQVEGPKPGNDNDLRRQIDKALKVLLIIFGLMLAFALYYFMKLTKPQQSVNVEPLPSRFELVQSIYGKSKKDSFQSIKGMDTDNEGSLYIADAGRSAVDVFSPDGKYIRSIGKKGDGKADIARPWSVAVDGQGDIYVADDYNHKIVVFGKDGKYKRHWLVMMPHFLDVIGEKIYLTTYGSFYIFDKNGGQIAKWAKRGRGYNQLDNAYGIVKDGDRIYIADSLNNRIVAFNKNGKIDWAFGKPSKQMTDPDVIFNMPLGLAQDENGLLYVTDPLDAAMYVVSKDKKIIEKFGGESGDKDGQFSFPADIKYLGNRKFAIADTGNKKVQIVEIGVTEKMEKAIEKTAQSNRVNSGKTWWKNIPEKAIGLLGLN